MAAEPTELSTGETLDLLEEMFERLRHERFIDHHEVNIDAQGRVSLPASYRPAFDGGLLHMAAVRDRNLEFWTPHTFDVVIALKRRLGASSLDGPRAMKMFQARTARVALDKQFRFVIPPAFRERIGLDPAGGRIVLAGTGEAVEIWSKESWDDLDHSGGLEDLEFRGM